MLKLLIADDEKIIRETIASLIDWNSIGLELIGAAKDGIEAYNIILDEYPDIVLTDIKMPGLSGLELIQRIYNINKDTQFIILSGYGEFDYAKKAMQYGVKHYLLKPCNEEQIITSLNEVIAYLTSSSPGNIANAFQTKAIHANLMIGVINDSLRTDVTGGKSGADKAIYDNYRNYIDFENVPYQVFYLYYVQQHSFMDATKKVLAYCRQNFSSERLYFLYVNNTLLFFMPANPELLSGLTFFLNSFSLHTQSIAVEYKQESFQDLYHALSTIMRNLRRYELIYFIDGTHVFPVYNYQNIIKETQKFTELLYSDDIQEADRALADLFHIFSSISDASLLKQLAASIVIFSVSKNVSFDMMKAVEFLTYLGHEEDSSQIMELLKQQITVLYNGYHSEKSVGEISRNIQELVIKYIGNPELSLKWIAENHLFMNVDYLSRRFLKETGLKFSRYLTETRISKSKEILASNKIYSIQELADYVGCGNNPQYFSQIFKKETGMTPSNYIKQILGHDV